MGFPGPIIQENHISSSFENLGLSAELLRAVAEQGYTVPTPIQSQAIPVVLAGRDLLGAAQTGTGKTAGFTLPMLQRLSSAGRSAARAPRALVLVPTRELAAQVEDSVRTYGRHLKLRTAVIFGGVGFEPQAAALRRGVDIVVATPGRLLDHAGERTVDLSGIDILVLDEADRMLDMGFIHDIRRVLALLPERRQNLLFSATFSDEIRRLAGTFLHDPATVEVAPRNAPVELIAQLVHPVDRDRRRELLAHLVKTGDWHQVLVFTRTKHGANRLAEQLERDGIEAAAIHGNKSQNHRTRTLERFRSNQVQVMVATDIAARGLDIEGLPHVVNFDLPHVPEDYVHRIGRTGRAGSPGEAVSLVCGEDRELLAAIERLIGRSIERREVSDFEPSAAWHSAQPEPQPQRGRANPRQGAGRERQRQQPRAQQRGEQQRGEQQRGEQQRGEQRRGEQRHKPGGGTAHPGQRGNAARPKSVDPRASQPRDRRAGAPGGRTQRPGAPQSLLRRPDEDERAAQARHHAEMQRAERGEAPAASNAGVPAARREPPKRRRAGFLPALAGVFGRKFG